jgi:soluble lytic murein transglycosylase-like protein
MHTIIPALLFILTTGDVDAERAYQYRTDSGTEIRMKSVIPWIDRASEKTDVPARLIAGLVYQESNAKSKVMGDGGISYGLGQIRCGVWGDWLKTQVDGYKQCDDLLKPKVNILSIAHILRRLKDRYHATWHQALELYNSGSKVKHIDHVPRKQKVQAYRKGVLYWSYRFDPFIDSYRQHVKPVLNTLSTFSTSTSFLDWIV